MTNFISIMKVVIVNVHVNLSSLRVLQYKYK